MTPKQIAYEKQAQTIIKNLEARGLEGHYFATSQEALKAILDTIPEGSTVANGGSMTIEEIGLLPAVKEGNYKYIDRFAAKTPEEKKASYSAIVASDYYLMSTNAITLDGVLVNTDGAGNRVACLIHGPANVIVAAGMNKVVTTIEEAIDRIDNIATPANSIRLNKNTPCTVAGVCCNCADPACIRAQTVITRRSMIPNRIKVYLIGEDLGY